MKCAEKYRWLNAGFYLITYNIKWITGHLITYVSQQPTPTGCRQVHCMQTLSIQDSPSEYCFPSNTHRAWATHRHTNFNLEIWFYLFFPFKRRRQSRMEIRDEILNHGISPLESKWHSMGAAEPPLVQRRNPVAANTQLITGSSIFIWSDQLVLLPSHLFPHLYILKFTTVAWRCG